jgi:energy-coupling factor transporter ATP-binding protein EcfA2
MLKKREKKHNQTPLTVKDYEMKPETLEQFVGNEEVIQRLKSTLEQTKDRPQVYLITGPSGCGKTTLARIMARKLNNIQGPLDSSFYTGLWEYNARTRGGLRSIKHLIDGSSRQRFSEKVKYPIFIFEEVQSFDNEIQKNLLKHFEEFQNYITMIVKRNKKAAELRFYILCTPEPDKLMEPLKKMCATFELSTVSLDETKEEGESISQEAKDYMRPKGNFAFIINSEKSLEAFQNLVSSRVLTFSTYRGRRKISGADAEDLEQFRNRDIVILQTKNDGGRKWAEKVYREVRGIAKTTKVIEPWGDCETFGDMVKDYFPDGYDIPKPPDDKRKGKWSEWPEAVREYMSMSLAKQLFRNCFYSHVEDPDSLDFPSLLISPDKPFLSGSGFRDADIPEPELLLSPWLRAGNITLISSKPGVGKTFFNVEIAEACAAGKDAFNGLWTTDKAVPALYVDGEMHPYDIKSRAISQRIFHTIFLSRMVYDTKNWGINFNLVDERFRHFLTEQIKKYGFRLVVLDNLYSLAVGIDHRFDNKDWASINQWMLELRSMGVAVIVVHHTTKSGDSAYGNALRDANYDSTFVLEKIGAHSENAAMFTIKIGKKRALVSNIAGNAFIFQDGEWEVREVDESGNMGLRKTQAEDKRRKIAKMLVEGVMGKDIAEKVNVKPSYITQTKTNLINRGYLIEVEKDNKTRVIFTEEGQAWYDAEELN